MVCIANIESFFLNAYWLKSGWVVLINYVFLTSYPRIIKSFLKSTDLRFAVNRVCYLRKDALNGFDVCIGSAQIKKKCALGLHSKKKRLRWFKCLPPEPEGKAFDLRL